MSKNKRRGSTTRKHKIPMQNSPSDSSKNVETDSDKQARIERLEGLLRIGKNHSGKRITVKEIGNFKAIIANLEHSLGIKYD